MIQVDRKIGEALDTPCDSKGVFWAFESQKLSVKKVVKLLAETEVEKEAKFLKYAPIIKELGFIDQILKAYVVKCGTDLQKDGISNYQGNNIKSCRSRAITLLGIIENL